MSGCFKNDSSLSLTVSETEDLPRLLGVLVSRTLLYTSDLLDGERLWSKWLIPCFLFSGLRVKHLLALCFVFPSACLLNFLGVELDDELRDCYAAFLAAFLSRSFRLCCAGNFFKSSLLFFFPCLFLGKSRVFCFYSLDIFFLLFSISFNHVFCSLKWM